MDLSDANRKAVKGSTSSELENRVKYHESKGWRKIGKSTVIHGVFRDEHIQVMEFEENE